MTNWKNLPLDTAEHMAHWLGLAAIYGSNFEELIDQGKMGVGGAGHPCAGALWNTGICFPHSLCTRSEQNPNDMKHEL